MHSMDVVSYTFAALWGGWLLFWLASARGNKPTVTRSGPRWRFIALAAVLVVWLGGRQFPEYFQRRLLPPSAAWEYIGLVLTTAGLGFTIWARRILGTNWSAMPTLKKDHELIQRGPYRLVRHPIYTGVLLAVFGSCLPGGRVSDFCVVGIATILLIVKLKAEEALLAGQFPDAYLRYRRDVKALIPFLY
jgi:protein-S-isoprenylcysteine O-methyltransferase Ste14